jgi:hypothetical protein
MTKQKMKFFTYTIFIIYFLFFYLLFFLFLGWARLNPAQHIYWWLGSAQPPSPASPARSLAQASDRLGKQLIHA